MKNLLVVIFVATLLPAAWANQPDLVQSSGRTPPNKNFVRGGSFKDLILPAPIIEGLESEGIWGIDKVLPRDKDNGMEDNQWCYWGGNPVKGNDGKYHIAVCRWPESTGHHGWFESEVAHCVSDNPIGPYVITKTIVKKGHNPEVMKMADGTFALHIMSSDVYSSDRMPGPWKRIGRMTMNPRGLRPTGRLGSNLTTEFRPDGSILLMTKGGDIAVSNSGILGPYNLVSIHNYTRNSGYAEDPVVWRSRHQYHSIYNHAQDRKSGYMRSLDGVHWKNEEGLPYDASSTYYTDGTKNEWYKFERPKILQDDIGRATHLSLALLDTAKSSDKGNDIHSSKNMISPLVVERLITIVSEEPITAETKRIAVRIEAEEGFNPQSDLDLDSLRFGSDSLVNLGQGCRAVSSSADGKDLVVQFEGDNGLNRFDYDFKLLGQTRSGDLVIGYTLLPGHSATAATLVALPVQLTKADGVMRLEGVIENVGLEDSEPMIALLMEHSPTGWEEVERISIPALKPYENRKVSTTIDNPNTVDCEYEIRVAGQKTCEGFWRRVDDTDDSVEFSGNWSSHPKSNPQYYMNNERITETVGDSVTFTFIGSKARAYGTLANEMGSFDVYLDGEFVESIRLSWGGPNSKLYQTEVLPEGKHTLELRAAVYQKSSKVAIDAFSFESPANELK
ncbi:hypothetical protein SAMN06265222_117132 [Neorhodopirellula lusitana]|uniref:Uncharacterized protein n=2 Tax=Neorhodopirellula lusitana TaxID=445327 RepID=A0ABY1QL15_9BACT|nr:hypothetical protein SAMN06265222_117132 [Neorhodopirellula lusitana]